MPNLNPIHYDDDLDAWFFWDETQAGRCGPFPSEVHAITAFEDYCLGLEPGPSAHHAGDQL